MYSSLALYNLAGILLAVVVGSLFVVYGKIKKSKQEIKNIDHIRGRLDYYLENMDRDLSNTGKSYRSIEKGIDIINEAHSNLKVGMEVIDRKAMTEIVLTCGKHKGAYYYIPPYNPELKQEEGATGKSTYQNCVPATLGAAHEFITMMVAQSQLAKYNHLTRDDVEKIIKEARRIYGKEIEFCTFKISYCSTMVRLSLADNYEVNVEQIVPCR